MAAQSVNFASEEFVANPYAVYAQLRQVDGPFWFQYGGPTGGMWLFTRYDHVATLLKGVLHQQGREPVRTRRTEDGLGLGSAEP